MDNSRCTVIYERDGIDGWTEYLRVDVDNAPRVKIGNNLGEFNTLYLLISGPHAVKIPNF